MRTQRMAFLIGASGAALTLFSSGCHKRPSGPSAHFERGNAVYQDLYVRELDDAYLDPKMDDAVAELRQVEPDSVSAHLATDLLAQIDKGKKDAIAARDARQKVVAAALKPTNLDASKVIKSDAVIFAEPAPPAVDAGAAVADPYGAGAQIADINRDSGGCLVESTPFREDGTGKSGPSYVLAADPSCKSKLPGFAGQTVLAVDGRIYRRVASTDMKVDKVLPGAPAFLPDGGVPPVTPAARALGGPAVTAPVNSNATAPLPPNAASLDSNVAAAQDATPRPAPMPATRGSTQTSGSASATDNVAAEQNATPSAPPVVQPASPVQDATPPPAQ